MEMRYPSDKNQQTASLQSDSSEERCCMDYVGHGNAIINA